MMGAQRGTNPEGVFCMICTLFLRNAPPMTSFHVSLLEQLGCSWVLYEF